MAKAIKRYQLLQGFQLMQYFNVGGKAVPVTFSHGIRKPYLIRGMFSTDVPELQEAIEGDNGFGTLFHLAHTDYFDDAGNSFVPEEVSDNTPEETIPETEVAEENISAEEHIEEAATDIPEAPAEEPKKTEPETTDYPEITTLKDAKQKLFDLFPGEFKPSNVPNKPALLNKAKAKNITFSKLV